MLKFYLIKIFIKMGRYDSKNPNGSLNGNKERRIINPRINDIPYL